MLLFFPPASALNGIVSLSLDFVAALALGKVPKQVEAATIGLLPLQRFDPLFVVGKGVGHAANYAPERSVFVLGFLAVLVELLVELVHLIVQPFEPFLDTD